MPRRRQGLNPAAVVAARLGGSTDAGQQVVGCLERRNGGIASALDQLLAEAHPALLFGRHGRSQLLKNLRENTIRLTAEPGPVDVASLPAGPVRYHVVQGMPDDGVILGVPEQEGPDAKGEKLGLQLPEIPSLSVPISCQHERVPQLVNHRARLPSPEEVAILGARVTRGLASANLNFQLRSRL